MHEMSLINDLVNKIESVARQQNVKKVVSAKVWLGAMSHISADHFREHFAEGTVGTVAEGASLDVEVSDDLNNPNSQDILLISIDGAEDE